MRASSVVAIVAIQILLSSYLNLNADDPKGDLSAVRMSFEELLLGRWEPDGKMEGQKFTVEFTKEGKITITSKPGDGDFNGKGTYKFTDDMTVEICVEILSEKVTNKGKILKLTADELVVRVESTNEEEKYKRVK
jgi:uncharacterized protein (TIGR03066 family)